VHSGVDYAGGHPITMMSSMVAETKLSRPGLSRYLIETPVRLQALDGSADVPFSLLSAPAGFGKTTLVSQWLEHRKPVYAWLTLDARDNTPALFWRSLSAALARVDPAFALRETTLMAALEPGAVIDPVALLVNRLSDYARSWQAARHLYLILDDFHLIREPTLLEQVRRFIDFAPDVLRLVCISRTDPPIRLAQLLARDQMLRLGPEHLCFDLEQTRQFVRLRRASASECEITRLHERTGGWPAALQLSAASPSAAVETAHIPSGAGSDALATYLLEEVFSQLEDDLRQFLMDVSLLPLFSEDIANHARQADDAGRQIAAMREHNLLLQHYGDGQNWFRLHDLLAEWLAPEVAPGPRTRQIRILAAEAFEQLGLVNEALELLVTEERFEQAEALLPALLLSDDLAGHRNLADRFPASIRAKSPALVILDALFCFLEGHFEQTLVLTTQAEALLEDGGHELSETLGFMALLLRCPSARFTGQQQVARSSIRQLSACLNIGTGGLRNWGLYTLGTDAFMDADLESARVILSQALAGAAGTEDSNCILRCLGVLIPVLIHRGQVTEAHRCFQRARHKLSTLPPVRDQPAMLAYLDGLLALEQNQLGCARARLDEASRLGRATMSQLDQVYLIFECFRLAMITGDEPGWRSCLDDLSELHQQMGGDWTYNIPELPALEALAALHQGDASLLMAWAAGQTGVTENQSHSRFCQLHERLLTGAGKVLMGVSVDEELDRLRQDAESGGNHLLACHVQLLNVLLLAYRDNDLHQAAQLLEKLLNRFMAGGVLRPFVDAAPTLNKVLEACVANGMAAAAASEVLALRKVSVAEPGKTRPDTSSGDEEPAPAVPEPLSRRERHVLKLLSEGLSNKRISETLGITVATVKTHLSNIYGKLDTGSRVGAVARARLLGLLE
jgi:LuxR family maltose regulon positive regulatory protein